MLPLALILIPIKIIAFPIGTILGKGLIKGIHVLIEISNNRNNIYSDDSDESDTTDTTDTTDNKKMYFLNTDNYVVKKLHDDLINHEVNEILDTKTIYFVKKGKDFLRPTFITAYYANGRKEYTNGEMMDLSKDLHNYTYLGKFIKHYEDSSGKGKFIEFDHGHIRKSTPLYKLVSKKDLKDYQGHQVSDPALQQPIGSEGIISIHHTYFDGINGKHHGFTVKNATKLQSTHGGRHTKIKKIKNNNNNTLRNF